ncbi:hypothetical protein FACS1894168_2680 [Deltaproteobacteria bacterium]|nr:hypothetical protein FACS1894168_2680 [Deltaproteobacteria bacterium]
MTVAVNASFKNPCWCGNARLVPWRADYALCPQCGGTLVSQAAIDEQLYTARDDGNSLYDEDYWTRNMLDQYRAMGCKDFDDVALLHYRERAAHWMRYFVRHLLPPAKIFEMGCGLGTFTHWASQLGFQAEASELSPAWRKIIGEKFGIAVSDRFPDAEQRRGKGRNVARLDAVCMFDVLEHIHNPRALLSGISAALTPKGQLWLQLPCYGGAGYAAEDAGFKRNLKAKEHLFLYSFASLCGLLRERGFERIIRHEAIFPGDMFLVASRREIPSYTEEERKKVFCACPSTLIPYANITVSQRLHDVENQLADVAAQSRRLVESLAAENAVLRRSLEKIGPAGLFSVQEPFLASLDYADYSAAGHAAAIDPAQVKRLLYIRLDGIGDCILSNAILAKIPQRFPRAEITVVCDTACRGLFSGFDKVTEVIDFDKVKLKDDDYFRQAVKILRACRADAVCNFTFSNTPRAFALSLLAEAPLMAVENDGTNCAGYVRKIFEAKINTLIPHANRLQREVDRNSAVLRYLQVPDDSTPQLALSDTHSREAEALWNSSGIAREKAIALFVGGYFPLKTYPRFSEALALLCKTPDMGVVALGSEREYDLSEQALSGIRARGVPARNFCGELPLMTSLAMLRGCKLALGVDTSFAHAAAALRTPHVIVLGGGHFGRFMPYSPYSTVVALPLDCYGCNWQCKHQTPYCVRGITPETLVFAVEQSGKEPLPGGGRLVIQKTLPDSRGEEQTKRPIWKSPEDFLAGNRQRGKAGQTKILVAP